MIAGFYGPYRFLSNFYPCQIVLHEPGWKPVVARSVEHAYQALKGKTVKDFEYVLAASSPGEAKRRGQSIAMREEWDRIKIDVMRNLVRKKFNSELGRKLLETGATQLVEGNWWNDTFWGVCNGVGENHLGKILMQVRDELRHPVVVAFDEFQTTHSSLFDGTADGRYLRNRLMEAFQNGWLACQRLVKDAMDGKV